MLVKYHLYCNSGGQPGFCNTCSTAGQGQAAHVAIDGEDAAVQLLLLLQQPDGRLEGEGRAAAACNGGDHADALAHGLQPLLVPG